ncbi:haloacid dehalogenase-like hydrolase [Thermobifida fusca]|jgi:phosphoglycolate phosphatase|uniref:Phosphoglycolate phosphatase n=3 Tax=Thermobifida fusca TaxID=2021 RepID=A0A9P2TAW8_THEFU|nr:haloacid dehalogenase-like hydrolase [Thermobifida fusca]AAZ55546.1 phosphoglycolate phosphatase [Thermobifida fusca YX]EOR71393.1 phosphoglycolate phosphatase [Thermobifida fusca TM51]QOS58110.1 haloacid dehalogenase-like hydrolase [Thermobifida fusca]
MVGRYETIGTVTTIPSPCLVLWDIDRTLLTVGTVSQELYAHAFASVVGRFPEAVAEMAGRTELAIITETLQRNGIRPCPDLVSRFSAALVQAAEKLRPRMREVGRALPGADAALQALHRLGAVQTVVTGNIRDLAAAKLAAFGLAGYLDLSLGGYGDQSVDRADLVRWAMARAGERHGPFDSASVVVVGDTPHDIRGAHDAGVRAVGVATGRSSRADLAAAGADAVLDDLTDTAAVVRLLTGTGELRLP